MSDQEDNDENTRFVQVPVGNLLNFLGAFGNNNNNNNNNNNDSGSDSSEQQQQEEDNHDSNDDDSNDDDSNVGSDNGDGSDNDDDDEDNRHSFSQWKRLIDLEDWSELSEVVERGSCRCHRNTWWKHLVRALGNVCCKGGAFQKKPPSTLIHDMIHTAVNMTRDEGQTLLLASHDLCDSGGKTLSVLLEWFSEMLHQSDLKRLLYTTTRGQGLNAIDEIWKRCFWNLDNNDDEHLNSLLQVESSSEPVEHALTKTQMMIDMVSNKNQSYSNILVAVLSAPCPNIAVHAAMKQDPSLVRRLDEKGNLPLHLAASNPVHHELVGVVTPPSHPVVEKVFGKPAVEMLLEEYPAAARIPNRDGRVPLNLALENYQKWRLARHKRESQRDCCSACAAHLVKPFGESIFQLVKAAPEALQARDYKTHLYPFLMAATHDTPLDLIYTLLRESPGVVQCGIQRTLYEVYLQNKLDEATRVQETQQAELESLKRERDEWLLSSGQVPSRKRTRAGLFGWFASY